MGILRTCILLFTIHLLNTVCAQEDKRAPSGFVGMRGKKFVEDTAETNERFFKRKPQFFIGVKGKKNLYDLIENSDASFKRAPMGFVGMRGKKDPFEFLYSPENYNYGPKRGSLIGQIDYSASDDFKDIKEEFPYLNELLLEYLAKLEQHSNSVESGTESNEIREGETGESLPSDLDKRAANMQSFFGVRGKKSIQNKRPFDLNFRGKFIGVRGKKDANQAQEIKLLLGQNGPWPKRKSQMGFFGMRGKKWTDDESSPETVSE